MVYAPLDYCLLSDIFALPRWSGCSNKRLGEMIEAMAYGSSNKAYRTARFRRALLDFQGRSGTAPKKPQWTLADALYYARNSYMVFHSFKGTQ